MKRTILYFTALLYCITAGAQNHVPNGSFEGYTACPQAFHQIDRATGWYQYGVVPPDIENGGTPDYFNECYVLPSPTGFNFDVPNNRFGHQAAFGKGYLGIYTYDNQRVVNYKEYAARQIIPLKKGVTYEVSMAVSLADTCGWGTDDLGIYFILDAPKTVNSNTVLPVSPQVPFYKYGAITDKTNWTILKAVYTADSAYSHIVIGGFKDSATVTKVAVASIIPSNSAYYYIDDVVVKPFDALKMVIGDTLLCPGNNISLPYTVDSGYFEAGNVFTAQLSNASGSFAVPVNLGSITATQSGVINCSLPAGLPEGAGYKIRIMASNPVAYVESGAVIDIYRLNPQIADVDPICAGESITLSATEKMPATLAWTGPGGFSFIGNDTTLTQTDTGLTGRYVVTATLGACTGKDSTDVLVKPMPEKPVVTTNSPLYEGETLMLNIANANGAYAYSWTGPEGFESSSPAPQVYSVAVKLTGTYTVTAMLDGCKSAASAEVLIQADNRKEYFILYPNPNNGNFTLTGYLLSDMQTGFYVINAVGQTVYEDVMLLSKGNTTRNITLPFLASGDYILRFRSPMKTYNFPFVIMH